MNIFSPPTTDPYLNLAMEEYFLRHSEEEFVMCWWSTPSVVVGKHQNALAEVNVPFVLKKRIPVIRRLSGGGTVFHGPGNLNFSFIRNGCAGRLVDFRKHTAPIIDFLRSLGIAARFEGKNDIRANGLKISGNAEHVYKNRLLHHGTLLFDADLDMLGEAMRVVPGRYTGRSVQSVRSRVGNIIRLPDRPMTFDGFKKQLEAFLSERFAPIARYSPDEKEKTGIRSLAGEKYTSWEWNYGYSPPYEFSSEADVGQGPIRLTLSVANGVIGMAVAWGVGRTPPWLALAAELPGLRHHPDDIFGLLKRHGLLPEKAGELSGNMARLFF